MISILIVLSLVGCAKQESITKLNGEVTIVYTNDVHTYVNNNKEDDENNVKPLLQYSSVKALKDELISQDYLLFASYCSSFTNGTINSANSPLASYEGYLLNYEDPHGSGRITFIK